MAAGLKVNALRNQIASQFPLEMRERGSALRLAAAPVDGVIVDRVAVDELHRCSRQPEEALIGLKGLTGHLLPRLLEGRRCMLLETNARVGRVETRRQ